MRPHSAKEVRDYLYRKTRDQKVKDRRSGEMRVKPGVSEALTVRVFERLLAKGYVDDAKFTRYWIDNRSLTKGASRRKLQAELQAKGVSRSVIEVYLAESDRSDEDEIQKVIAKKARRYDDPQKLMQYLARQGFSYDQIKEALAKVDEE